LSVLATKLFNVVTRYPKWWSNVEGGFRVDIYSGATTAAEPPSSYHTYRGTVVVPVIDIRGGWGSSTSPWPSTPWSTIDGRQNEAPIWAKAYGSPLINYTYVFEGWVYFPADGNYLVDTYSDDGIRIYVDGNRVIDLYTFHGPTESYNYTYISKGWHRVKVVYFEGTGQWVCMVGFSLGGWDARPISILKTQIYPA